MEQIIARTPFEMHLGTFRVQRIFINYAISLDFCAKNPFDLSVLKQFLNRMSPYFALSIVENNKNKNIVKFQGDMLNVFDFIQVFVFTTNNHLKSIVCLLMLRSGSLICKTCIFKYKIKLNKNKNNIKSYY